MNYLVLNHCDKTRKQTSRYLIMELIKREGAVDRAQIFQELGMTPKQFQGDNLQPVSYTHLTLPTIYSV